MGLLSPHTYNFLTLIFCTTMIHLLKINVPTLTPAMPSSEFTLESTLDAGDLDKYIEMQITAALYLLNV